MSKDDSFENTTGTESGDINDLLDFKKSMLAGDVENFGNVDISSTKVCFLRISFSNLKRSFGFLF